jgi:hypothetical protein
MKDAMLALEVAIKANLEELINARKRRVDFIKANDITPEELNDYETCHSYRSYIIEERWPLFDIGLAGVEQEINNLNHAFEWLWCFQEKHIKSALEMKKSINTIY